MQLEEYPNAYYIEELSIKDFTNKSLEDFHLNYPDKDELLIVGSCFYQTKIKSVIYPEDAELYSKIILHNCNCDNCILPNNAILSGVSCNNLIKEIDGVSWFVDVDLNPIKKVSLIEEGVD